MYIQAGGGIVADADPRLEWKESLKKNIDPKITRRIWKNIIWSYIDFEKRNFKKKVKLFAVWR